MYNFQFQEPPPNDHLEGILPKDILAAMFDSDEEDDDDYEDEDSVV